MSTLKYDALVRRYEAEIAEAKAVLEVYFAASVGVGVGEREGDAVGDGVGVAEGVVFWVWIRSE